ncbi:MAG: TrkA family potassium uptake protein [Methanocalculaceae archaeon]|jgi:trk system potassium uptake protein TrkA|nr:TrkA family potassium uptake protein [Methanocalculaceae archaeon]
MYLVIVGLGGIGKSLAGIASENGHSVAVIDRDEERCAEILRQYDLLAIAGNATDKSILEDAGVDRADALVATTSDDALNLMACWLAKRYNVRTLVSIVNQTEHADLFKEVGVRISENPDEIVARSLYVWSENPDTKLLASIEGGSIFEITVNEGTQGVGKAVREVSKVKDMLYIAIRRGGKLIIPSGNVIFQPDDAITVFTKKESEGRSVKYMSGLFH